MDESNDQLEDGHVKAGYQARWRALATKFSRKANSAELSFLSLLRFTALVIAALTLIGSAILLGYGIFQQVGRTEVDAKNVTVSVDDVAPMAPASEEDAPSTEPAKFEATKEIRDRTLQIYRSKFKKFQRSDTKITDKQVVDLIWSEERMELFGNLAGDTLLDMNGQVVSGRIPIMHNSLDVVESATGNDEFAKQLAAYRDAKKVRVCTDEVRTRNRTIASWDSYSTDCAGWYMSPIGCPSTRTVEEPYVEKICEMKFPEDLEAPAEQFANAIQRYAEIAQAKLEAAQLDAENQTAENKARKLEGWGNIVTSGKLFVSFLVLMFFYLFIAIERHHRSLRTSLNSPSNAVTPSASTVLRPGSGQQGTPTST